MPRKNEQPKPRTRPLALAKTVDTLPPHSDEIERAALSCVLQSGAIGSTPEVDALLVQLKTSLFYDLRHQLLFAAMIHLRMENHAVDIITVVERLKATGDLDKLGGGAGLSQLQDAAPSILNFPTYLAGLRKLALRRWTISKSAVLNGMGAEENLSVDDLQSELAELYDKSQRIGDTTRQRLKVWRVGELMKWTQPAHTALVGDNEIKMGYEGVCVVGGPGSSGKSLCVSALALAGAMGCGTWMGRKVHRKFKTLIIQAENGSGRLKKEVSAFVKNHPEFRKQIEDSIFFSDPPEGGLPFHKHEFRAAVRRAIEDLKPDLVVIDPWSQVATEDAANEVVDKINEIRSCFPGGDACPGLLIVAHTKKPRAEDVRKGRALVHSVSGSIALVNTARCVYVLLPWSDDMTDDRIYWSCPKLNDGEMYAPTVWRRRFGTFFEHDDKTDATTWGKTDDEDSRHSITEEQLRDCFEKTDTLKKSTLVKSLVKTSGASSNTCYRALDEDGYLRRWLMRDGNGGLKLKEPNE